jgi:predicted DNA binding CopG/RHH family protein
MKKRIPKFKSLEEERKFWNTHSITEFMDELKPAKIEFAKPKKKLVSVRLDTNQIQSLKAIALHKGLGYLSLMRFWIQERLSKERRVLHTQRN